MYLVFCYLFGFAMISKVTSKKSSRQVRALANASVQSQDKSLDIADDFDADPEPVTGSVRKSVSRNTTRAGSKHSSTATKSSRSRVPGAAVHAAAVHDAAEAFIHDQSLSHKAPIPVNQDIYGALPSREEFVSTEPAPADIYGPLKDRSHNSRGKSVSRSSSAARSSAARTATSRISAGYSSRLKSAPAPDTWTQEPPAGGRGYRSTPGAISEHSSRKSSVSRSRVKKAPVRSIEEDAEILRRFKNLMEQGADQPNNSSEGLYNPYDVDEMGLVMHSKTTRRNLSDVKILVRRKRTLGPDSATASAEADTEQTVTDTISIPADLSADQETGMVAAAHEAAAVPSAADDVAAPAVDAAAESTETVPLKRKKRAVGTKKQDRAAQKVQTAENTSAPGTADESLLRAAALIFGVSDPSVSAALETGQLQAQDLEPEQVAAPAAAKGKTTQRKAAPRTTPAARKARTAASQPAADLESGVSAAAPAVVAAAAATVAPARTAAAAAVYKGKANPNHSKIKAVPVAEVIAPDENLSSLDALKRAAAVVYGSDTSLLELKPKANAAPVPAPSPVAANSKAKTVTTTKVSAAAARKPAKDAGSRQSVVVPASIKGTAINQGKRAISAADLAKAVIQANIDSLEDEDDALFFSTIQASIPVTTAPAAAPAAIAAPVVPAAATAATPVPAKKAVRSSLKIRPSAHTIAEAVTEEVESTAAAVKAVEADKDGSKLQSQRAPAHHTPGDRHAPYSRSKNSRHNELELNTELPADALADMSVDDEVTLFEAEHEHHQEAATGILPDHSEFAQEFAPVFESDKETPVKATSARSRKKKAENFEVSPIALADMAVPEQLSAETLTSFDTAADRADLSGLDSMVEPAAPAAKAGARAKTKAKAKAPARHRASAKTKKEARTPVPRTILKEKL